MRIIKHVTRFIRTRQYFRQKCNPYSLVLGYFWATRGQIPGPGDYFLGHMGKVSVIVVRGRDGQINVLENRCAHRGTAVCTQRTGVGAQALACPYHGWTFNLDGSLRGIPAPSDYGPSFPKEARGLKRAAKIESYRGFIFASLAVDAPDLKTFLDEAALALDNFIDRSPTGEIEPVSSPLRHLIRANWKLVFENLGDTIHPLFAHASFASATKAQSEDANNSVAMFTQPNRVFEALQNVSSVTTRFGHNFQVGLDQMTGFGKRVYPGHFSALRAVRGDSEAKPDPGFPNLCGNRLSIGIGQGGLTESAHHSPVGT